MHGIKDARAQPARGTVDQQADRPLLLEQGDDFARRRFAFGECDARQAFVKTWGVAVQQGTRAIQQ